MLSLAEAATRMGQSIRQVRYLVKKGRLNARKVGPAWMIDEADLPSSEADASAHAVRAADVRQAVEAALAPQVRPGARYSVTSIRAFTDAANLRREAGAALPADHPAPASLDACALALARGAHAWRGRAFARSKRRRPNVARIDLEAERHVLQLASDIVSGRRKPGGYRVIRIRDPR